MNTYKLNDGDKVEVLHVGQVTIGQLVMPEEVKPKRKRKKYEKVTPRIADTGAVVVRPSQSDTAD